MGAGDITQGHFTTKLQLQPFLRLGLTKLLSGLEPVVPPPQLSKLLRLQACATAR